MTQLERLSSQKKAINGECRYNLKILQFQTIGWPQKSNLNRDCMPRFTIRTGKIQELKIKLVKNGTERTPNMGTHGTNPEDMGERTMQLHHRTIEYKNLGVRRRKSEGNKIGRKPVLKVLKLELFIIKETPADRKTRNQTSAMIHASELHIYLNHTNPETLRSSLRKQLKHLGSPPQPLSD